MTMTTPEIAIFRFDQSTMAFLSDRMYPGQWNNLDMDEVLESAGTTKLGSVFVEATTGFLSAMLPDSEPITEDLFLIKAEYGMFKNAYGASILQDPEDESQLILRFGKNVVVAEQHIEISKTKRKTLKLVCGDLEGVVSTTEVQNKPGEIRLKWECGVGDYDYEIPIIVDGTLTMSDYKTALKEGTIAPLIKPATTGGNYYSMEELGMGQYVVTEVVVTFRKDYKDWDATKGFNPVLKLEDGRLVNIPFGLKAMITRLWLHTDPDTNDCCLPMPAILNIAAIEPPTKANQKYPIIHAGLFSDSSREIAPAAEPGNDEPPASAQTLNVEPIVKLDDQPEDVDYDDIPFD